MCLPKPEARLCWRKACLRAHQVIVARPTPSWGHVDQEYAGTPPAPGALAASDAGSGARMHGGQVEQLQATWLPGRLATIPVPSWTTLTMRPRNTAPPYCRRTSCYTPGPHR